MSISDTDFDKLVPGDTVYYLETDKPVKISQIIKVETDENPDVYHRGIIVVIDNNLEFIHQIGINGAVDKLPATGGSRRKRKGTKRAHRRR